MTTDSEIKDEAIASLRQSLLEEIVSHNTEPKEQSWTCRACYRVNEGHEFCLTCGYFRTKYESWVCTVCEESNEYHKSKCSN